MDKDQSLEEENAADNTTNGKTVSPEQPATPETETESEAETTAEPELPSKVRFISGCYGEK